ncbi:MAG TPA: heavy metal-binding domain-containing protein [Chitinophagaceae bacterium]|nr:heavy metal-binding domain-containing protein [Chitinophagaceae bacterium]
MKSIKKILLVVMALFCYAGINAQPKKEVTKKATADSVAYRCPMNCEKDKTYAKAGRCPVCNMNLRAVARQTEAYRCPMNCEKDKTYAKAGKCPVCNMNLVKNESKQKEQAEHHHNHN